MTVQCIGHVEVPDEKWEDLKDRYGQNPVGFVAELAKKNHERRIEHDILTSVGIPSETEQGRALCLVARLAILAERYEEASLNAAAATALATWP